MAIYENLSKQLAERMQREKAEGTFQSYAFDESKVLRRHQNPNDSANVWRTAFIRDIDKIQNCPYFNRYADKTQVFSLYKNDDITHRSLHVQLVSRIARTLGKALHLNLDLIEAIALGHDIGHTPFGHTGERFLDDLYRQHTNRRFAHNVHSVRVLDTVFDLNVSLQTLDGILAHNGELELSKYTPKTQTDFMQLDQEVENCYQSYDFIQKLVPATLEGCVVRIADIIAYLGKDRQDAEKNKLTKMDVFNHHGIGIIHAEISNNLIVNILENSYSKPYIKMDDAHFEALKKAKKENYERIYQNDEVKSADLKLQQMMALLYEKLLKDLKDGVKASPIFTHHIDYLNKPYYNKNRRNPYIETEPNLIVVDYIASMTDDYFIDLFYHLFPSSTIRLQYKGYFD